MFHPTKLAEAACNPNAIPNIIVTPACPSSCRALCGARFQRFQNLGPGRFKPISQPQLCGCRTAEKAAAQTDQGRRDLIRPVYLPNISEPDQLWPACNIPGGHHGRQARRDPGPSNLVNEHVPGRMDLDGQATFLKKGRGGRFDPRSRTYSTSLPSPP